MKRPKTAPQFLEHYGVDYLPSHEIGQILKAMRAYKNYKLDQEYEDIRKEAIENVVFQYEEHNIKKRMKEIYDNQTILNKAKKKIKEFYKK